MLRRWSTHGRSRFPSWVAAALCIAWIAEPIAAAAHDASTGHAICEHGALVDVLVDAALKSGEPEQQALVGPLAADSAVHAHCSTAAIVRGREGVVHATRAVNAVAFHPLAQARPAPARPGLAPVVVAPKTSPPQAASI